MMEMTMVFRDDDVNNYDYNADSHDEPDDDGVRTTKLTTTTTEKVTTTKAILIRTATMLTTIILVVLMMIIIVQYYDDESYCFRYQIMLNCWQEESGDRPSFEQLRHELKLMANQHTVIYRNLYRSFC